MASGRDSDELQPPLEPPVQQGPYGDIPEPYLDDHMDDPLAGGEPPGRGGRLRLLLKLGVVLVALAIFSGVVWYAYTWGLEQGGRASGLPVVRAADGPEKVAPDDPGGMKVPYQDKLVLNETGSTADEAKVERLLPPPETPMPPEPRTAQAGEGGAESSGDATLSQLAEIPEADMPEVPPPPSESAGASGGASDASESGDPTAEPEQASPPASSVEAPQPPPPAPSGKPAAAGSNGATSTGGDYLVQLAALRDSAGARREWRRLQQAHSALLGGMRLALQRVDVAGKGTFWRVRTGPFASRALADDMCGRLKARDQACLVVKR